MKFDIKDATVVSVTPVGEHHGEEVVLAKSLKIEAAVTPRALDTLSPKIRKFLFDNDIPTVPELGTIDWKPEYEKAHVQLQEADVEGAPLLTFTKADVKKIAFAAREGFLFDLTLTVKVTPDHEQAGDIDFLLKKNVHLVIEKATQKRIEDAADEGGEKVGKDDKQQPTLPNIQPLLKTADLQAANEAGTDPTATAALAALDAAVAKH